MIVNLKLQQRSQLVYVLFSHIKAFEAKLELFKKLLSLKNLSHFPVMKQLNCSDYTPTFVECISKLQRELGEQFKDFRSREQEMIFVTQPFSVEAGDAPTELQMELIDLQCNEFLKGKFNETPLIDFYRKYVPSRKLYQSEETRSRSNFSFRQHLPLRTIIFTQKNKPNQKFDLPSRMAILRNVYAW